MWWISWLLALTRHFPNQGPSCQHLRQENGDKGENFFYQNRVMLYPCLAWSQLIPGLWTIPEEIAEENFALFRIWHFLEIVRTKVDALFTEPCWEISVRSFARLGYYIWDIVSLWPAFLNLTHDMWSYDASTTTSPRCDPVFLSLRIRWVREYISTYLPAECLWDGWWD